MSRTEDIAPLIAAATGSEPDVGFAQGVVVLWDEATGENVVNVKGTNLTNLPALNIGEFAILQENDVVGLLRFKSTYFILGRIILPQGPGRNRASVDFDAWFGAQSNLNITTTATNFAEAALTEVPDWADQAIIMSTHYAAANAKTFGPAYLSIAGYIDGRLGPTGQFLAPAANSFASGSIGNVQIINNPPDPILVHTRLNSTTNDWGSDAANYASTQAVAIFRRID